MTDARLKSLVIENFRSLRGKIVVPLDAQVVLIHGTNGMGKTSVLSALELGLTGQIAHLAASSDDYKSYLTNLEATSGSISLNITQSLEKDGPLEGTVTFSNQSFLSKPLLSPQLARFFAERSYLPQATLGRLLEIYDDQKASSTSPLTLFVKELLGLDPLDALVDGLAPAFHVSRVRKIAPDYRRLEALKSSLESHSVQINVGLINQLAKNEEQRVQINALLLDISGRQIAQGASETELSALRSELANHRELDDRISQLARSRLELAAFLGQWQSLPVEDQNRDRAEKERQDQLAVTAFANWRSGNGAALDRAISETREIFPDLPELDDNPELSRLEALRRVKAEHTRATGLLTAHVAATARAGILEISVQRITQRLGELNADLSEAAQDAKSLANALAGVVPHITGEHCPICDRDFSDVASEPLSAHVAKKIASLTSEAGRLQALATTRAEESKQLAAAQRELLTTKSGQLSAEDFAEHTVREAFLAGITHQLSNLASVSAEGVELMEEAKAARQRLIVQRRRNELSVSMLPEIDAAVTSTIDRSVSTFSSVEEALKEAISQLDVRVDGAERLAALRLEIQSKLDQYIRDLADVLRRQIDAKAATGRLAEVDEAIKNVDASRSEAKSISAAADAVRSNIVKKVFSTSLNKTWRDLFVRLAPSEHFVPAFKLPVNENGTLEAVLETLHRSGQASGAPGAMLSQGNLNTAALTLFLALHLSVPMRTPWLILDDPVQSMDDVHIAQFAALLRSLSKGMKRQIVIAVHERALFDYLTLELSPAFAGDSLISIEISRNFDGETIAMPTAFSFQEDKIIAA